MAVRCLFLQVDTSCEQDLGGGVGVPTTARPDAGTPPTRPLSISASVGLGGVNRPLDVKNIQRALNHILPEVGGAIPFLDDDGFSGLLTRAAIQRFQKVNFAFADSRVDRSQKTITRMEQLLTLQPSSPTGGHPSERVAFTISRLHVASQCIQAAASNISSVLPFVAAGTTPDSGVFGSLFSERMALLERHFKISEFGNDTAKQLARLRGIYRDMRAIIARSIPASPDLHNPFGDFLGGGVFAFDPHPKQRSPKTVAYTTLGGKFLRGETFLQPPRPADRIYLRPLLDRTSAFFFTEVTIHELAHFVSPFTPAIGDHGYGWITDPRIQRLSAQKRVVNAQNFSTYALESKFGQREIRVPL